MRIPDNILDCVAYLYPSESDALMGMRAGGSGFLVGVDSEGVPGDMYVYAVSNAHVVQDAPVLRLNKAAGGMDVLRLDVGDWSVSSTADVAICPVGIPDRFKYNTVDFAKFLTDAVSKEHGIGVGDETFLAGRFINHEGRQANTPVARTGTIAMMPHETIYAAGRQYMAYLVETRVIGGYSGSPVFVHVPPLSPRAGRSLSIKGYGQWLLGIEAAYVYERLLVIDQSTGKEGANSDYVMGNTGMSVVIPAKEIADMIMDDEHLEARKANDQKVWKERADT